MSVPLLRMAPEPETEKPGLGEAPWSHWNWVVGGVRMQPRPDLSVMPPSLMQ